MSAHAERKAWRTRGASAPHAPLVARSQSARDVLQALRAQGRIDEATQLANALARGDIERIRGLIAAV